MEGAVAAAERLIGVEKVPVVFTSPAGTTTLAVLPTLQKNKTPGMSFVAFAPAVTSPELSHTFRSTLTSINNVNPSVDFLVKEKGIKTIACPMFVWHPGRPKIRPASQRIYYVRKCCFR